MRCALRFEAEAPRRTWTDMLGNSWSSSVAVFRPQRVKDRLTGKAVQPAGADQTTLNLIADRVGEQFFPRLNGAELAHLIAELERVAFGYDIAARDAARHTSPNLPGIVTDI